MKKQQKQEKKGKSNNQKEADNEFEQKNPIQAVILTCGMEEGFAIISPNVPKSLMKIMSAKFLDFT